MSTSASVSIPPPRNSVEDSWSGQASPPEPPAGALSLLLKARTCLHDGQRERRASERYVAAYLAAARGSTAIVVARAWRRADQPPASVWRLLVNVAPELREWADFFAGCAERRAKAEAGVPMSDTDADALLRRAGEFLDIVGRCLLGTPR